MGEWSWEKGEISNALPLDLDITLTNKKDTVFKMILQACLLVLAALCLTAASPPSRGARYKNSEEDSTRIGNGDESEPRKRTYMALIGTGTEDDKDWICGGSLIAPRFVLSAAHCSKTKHGIATWVRVGELDIATTRDDARPQDRRIAEIINHPEYKEPAYYHDIALYRLEGNVHYDSYVQPICLNREQSTPSGEGLVAGWGSTEFAGAYSTRLLEVFIDFFNDTECHRLKNEISQQTPQGIVSGIMFCAGKSDGSKDCCTGDSGGPLVIEAEGPKTQEGESKTPDDFAVLFGEEKPEEQECQYVQVGVVSYGEMCLLPDSPGVYTRVSAYVDWIEGQLSRFHSSFS